MVFGAVFGTIWAAVGYSVTGGHRDFTSVTQVVATKYEVLTEHKLAQQARDLLDQDLRPDPRGKPLLAQRPP